MKMPSQQISAFVITLNEAENIARCLDSLRVLTDEIIVVDSGSTDATQQIARERGAHVVEQEWLDFVGQKNFALAQCRHDWVLTLDADEEISSELRAELEKVRPNLGVLSQEGVGGFAMPRKVFYRGRWINHGDWNPDFVTRLFRREGARYEGALVHERIAHVGQTRKLNAPIFHYTYRDRADHLARLNKYSALWAQSRHAEGKRAGIAAAPLRAAWRFWRAAFLKRGFLDGIVGLDIAALSAYEVWLKYRKLRELERQS